MPKSKFRFPLLILCIIALTFLGVGPVLAGDLPSSTQAPDQYQAVPSAATPSAQPLFKAMLLQAATPKALLIQDYAPWGYDSNRQALGELGIPYDAINSGSLAAQDLSGYSFIMYASDQDNNYYNNLMSNLGKISSYVSGGGLLIAHCCNDGWHSGNWTSILPDNVAHVNNYNDTINITDYTNGVIVGNGTFTLTDPYLIGWNYSTHGYFTNLPAGAQQVMIAPYGPTYIEYGYGQGKVLATMNTVEWGYSRLHPELLRNELRYALQNAPELASWAINSVTQLDTGKDWTCDQDFENISQTGTDTAQTVILLEDTNADGKDDKANVTITNGYPAYYNSITLNVTNNGTEPITLKQVKITNNSPEALDINMTESLSSIIYPGKKRAIGIEFRALDGSAPGDYSFTVSL